MEHGTPTADVNASIRPGRIEVPGLPTSFVARAELRAELEAQAGPEDAGQVVLVSAPPGSPSPLATGRPRGFTRRG